MAAIAGSSSHAAASKEADAAAVIPEDDDGFDFQLRETQVNASHLKGKVDGNAADFGLKVRSQKEMAGDPLFACEKTSEGEKFMAVKPWLGAIKAPTNPPAVDGSAPAKSLALDWVYGYRGYDSFGNVAVNTKGQLVYPIAGVVVTYDAKSHSQQHCRAHTDDVVCLAQNPANRDIVASGQVATLTDGVATHPHIVVHDTVKRTEWILKSNGVNLRRAVRAVAFSADGKLLASIGGDDNQSVTIWDWEKKTALATEKADTSTLFQLKWNHIAGKTNEFATVGIKHMFFWTWANGKLSKKRGSLGGKYALQTFYSVAYSAAGAALVGARDGSIYAFVDGACKKVIEKAHAGAVLSIDYYPEGAVTGGEDGKALVFDKTLKVVNTLPFEHGVRAVTISGNDLALGTAGCQIYRVNGFVNAKVDGKTQPDVVGHFDGELWSLSTHPSAPAHFITASEDNRVFEWNLNEHKLAKSGIINAKAGAKPKVRKAATDSKHAINQCARAVEYSPDGKHVALGTNSGEVVVLTAADLKPAVVVDLNKYGSRQVTEQKQNWIEAIAYSPNGKFLAVGTHGMVIVLLDVAKGYAHAGTLKAHNAAITHLDWSSDSKHIQSVCRAYELLFWDVDEKAPANSVQNKNPTALRDVAWATQTVLFGWSVQGIFKPSWDGTDVNYVSRSPSKTLLVTGDDFGGVNLFRYPCAKAGAVAKTSTGHSAHVTRVRFTADEKFVISTGGGDKAIFQWKLV